MEDTGGGGEGLILKLVHGEGPSRITLDSNRQIASCGLDSVSVVFHNGGLEEDSYQFDIESGSVSSVTSVVDVACYKKGEEYMVAVATSDRTVLSYSYCSGNINDDPFAESEFKAILVRFTSNINSIDISNDDTKLAAGASDFLIKTVDLTDTTKVSTMEGHEAPVLCVKFDPLTHYLSSSSCDGTVKIWSVQTKVLLHSIEVFPKVNDIMFASTLCRLSWQPGQGQTLAVPVGNCVKLYERDSWNSIKTINEQEGKSKKFDHVTCWSPCGDMLAIGSSDGSISVYKGWPHPSLVSRHSVSVSAISSLCWDPLATVSTHPLLFSSSSGHIGALPRHWVHTEGEGEEGERVKEKNNNVVQQDNEPISETDDQLFDDSLLLEGIPPDSIFNDEEDAQELANCKPAPSPPPLPPPVGKRTTNQIDGNRVHDDDNMAPPTKRRHIVSSDNEDEREDDRVSPQITSTSDAGTLQPPIPPPPPLVSSPIPPPPPPPEHYHEIFQPSATPSHLTNRFMVYNMVGMVRYHDDGSSPMVEVEFHDTSVHHPFSIPNHYGWSMAALSSKALVLAAEGNDEEPSQFQCTVFSSWDNNKDWSQQLPKGEVIEVVALGDTWIAVATDKNYIRLFSLGGTQREIISIPGGQVVTLSGRGDQLIIVYQELPKSSLSVWVLDVGQRREVYPPHQLPLTHKAKLEWIGFSESGIIISYDTKGVVRMFSNQYGLSWLPVVDCDSLLNQKGDHYYIVGMTHDPNQMRVILCKGLVYPPVHPRPVMTTIPLTIPLCEPNTEKTNIEAQCVEKLFVHPPDVAPSPTDMLTTLMQLMALACHSNHEFRAFELVDMMTSEQGLELALQYASQSGHFRLARQISNLKERRAIAAAEEEEEEEETNHYYYTHHQSLRNNSTALNDHLRRSYDSRQSITRQSTSGGTSQEPKDSSRTSLSARRILLLKPTNKENLQKEEEEEEEKMENEEDTHSNEIGGGEDGGEVVSNHSLDESTDIISGASYDKPVDSLLTSPQVNKITNPFRITTPVSKQIQVERRSSFLDKISQEVQEEKEKEKEKKKSKLKPANSVTNKVKGKKKKNTNGTGNNAKLAAFAFTKKS